MTPEEIAAWVKTALDTAGISYAEASRKLGMPLDGISKVIRCKRDLLASEMTKLAEMTGEASPILTHDGKPQPRYVTVRGEVAAGLWRDVQNEEFEEFDFIALVDTRWPAGAVYGLVVRGESINKKAADGDRIVALDFEHAPRDLQSGDWVVVERYRDDIRERTVKQAAWDDSEGWQLWPRSNDPKHQNPLTLGEHDGESVRVVAFVLDFVSTATKF